MPECRLQSYTGVSLSTLFFHQLPRVSVRIKATGQFLIWTQQRLQHRWIYSRIGVRMVMTAAIAADDDIAFLHLMTTDRTSENKSWN